jgi:hypothetical protein
MKPVILSALSVILLISCQKQITEKQISTQTEDNNEVSIDDSVVFPDRYSGNMEDDHSGLVVCSLWPFFVYSDADSIYPKDFKLIIKKTSGVHINKVVLYIDGIRMKGEDNIPDDVDTLDLFLIAANRKAFPVKADSYDGSHTMAIRLKGTGASGESYQVNMVSALFINKKDTPQTLFQTKGLPILGDICTYK